jgi:hypothetical protein
MPLEDREHRIEVIAAIAVIRINPRHVTAARARKPITDGSRMTEISLVADHSHARVNVRTNHFLTPVRGRVVHNHHLVAVLSLLA